MKGVAESLKRVTKSLGLASGDPFLVVGSQGVEAGSGLWEFRLVDGEGDDFAAGGEIKVDIFEEGQKVDVQGTSIGKGFAGVIKRHNFHMQDATHGNSLSHRAPGSD